MPKNCLILTIQAKKKKKEDEYYLNGTIKIGH